MLNVNYLLSHVSTYFSSLLKLVCIEKAYNLTKDRMPLSRLISNTPRTLTHLFGYTLLLTTPHSFLCPFVRKQTAISSSTSIQRGKQFKSDPILIR